MIILCLRTDKPQADLALYDNRQCLATDNWEAHRALADTIHSHIEQLLQSQQRSWSDIGGIVCYRGPGSFTGLRIGMTVANTIAQDQNVPIVAENSEAWFVQGIERLLRGESEQLALPEYGSPANVTTPKK